jgi:hypothetical protein
MPAMLAGYIRLIVFAVGLLVGVQVPAFVDQYVKRVSAHQSEAVKDFSGFQQTADKYFGGDVQALIAHHSADIRTLYERLTVLTAELAALRGSLASQLYQMLFHGNPEILAETRAEYSYTVPLKPAAIVCGVALGACAALLIESVLVGSLRVLRPRRRRARLA